MNIEIKDINDVRVIKLCERIDIHNVFDVEEEIMESLDNNISQVIFNFDKVEYFGSNGIRILMLAKKNMDKIHGEMALVCVNQFVLKILKAIELIDLFTILDSEEDAMEFFTKSAK